MDLTATITESGRQRRNIRIDLGEGRPLPDNLRWLDGFPGTRRTKDAVILPLDFYVLHHALETAGEPIELTIGLQDWYTRHKEWIQHKRQSADLDDAELPHYSLAHLLYPFQRAGAAYLAQNPRAILADEAGLGKTAQCIAAAHERDGDRRLLVICNNSHKWWWRAEIRRWSIHRPPVTVVEAATRELDFARWRDQGGWLILNWDLVRLMPELRTVRWQWIFADEAHKIKNRTTKRFKAFQQLESHRIVLVTASPFSNNPAEVWALLKVCRPDWFGSYWRFYELFVDYTVHFKGFREVRGMRNPDLLAYTLAGFMLRRYKTDVGVHLPPKTHTTMPLRLLDRQIELYNQMAQEMLMLLESGEELEATTIVAQITRLRQVVSGTATLEDTDVSCKLDAVLDILAERPDSKVVVFAQFRATVKALTNRLLHFGIPSVSFMGGVPPHEVATIVEAFQTDPTLRVLISTTGAGGESHTFTAADTVIFVEQHWNPDRQLQAEDRIHRIGQTKPVQIIKLHCPQTIDDTVVAILERKLAMTDKVLRHVILRDLTSFMKLYGGAVAISEQR